MGTVRALDAGTLSLPRLFKLIHGADLTTLTDPLTKVKSLATMRRDLAELESQPPKKKRGR